MSAAAADIITAPQTGWWSHIWPAPWYLTCASALTWALLRAREKSVGSPPTEENNDPQQEGWEKAA
jgi:hypothetical protein